MSIIATSQQSRFHAETLATASKEIDLKTVNISIGKLDVIVDSHLRLKAGVRYACLGRNGTGKSTLLSALRDGLIPGLPPTVRILLVSQTEEDSSPDLKNNAVDSSATMSVLEKVIASDRPRARAMLEFETLTKAVETNSKDLSKIVAEIELERIRDEMDERKRIASRRSGARGKEARIEEEKAEAKFQEAEQALASLSLNSVLDITDALNKAVDFLGDLQVTLDLLDYKTTVARASSILIGLGFTQEMINAPYTSLSGGWRSRCALGAGLLVGSEVLLLDEPNNFLDLEATIWLEQYITEAEAVSDRTVVIVSHDQDFLNRVVDETIYLREKTLRYFEGTPAQLEIHERKERKRLTTAQSAMDKKKAHIETSIKNGRATAKKTGDENRLRMVKSRQKKLDERWGMEKSASGHRFKLNNDMVGYHLSNRAEIKIEEGELPVKIVIPEAPKLRTLGNLLSFEKVAFRYPSGRTKKLTPGAKNLLEDVTFSIDQGGRIAFVGSNGQGKSTIVKLITGELTPVSGTILRHPSLTIGHYGQHSVEDLSKAVRGTKMTAMEHFISYFLKKGIKVEQSEAHRCLGSLGLGKAATTTPVDRLSGGQRVRLAFALVIFNPPALLLLDEVTTHLDLATIKGLAVALRNFDGGIVLVTHDRWFAKVVIELVSLAAQSDDPDDDESDDSEDEEELGKKKGTVFRVGGGKVKVMERGMDEYTERVEKLIAKRKRLAAAAATAQ